MDKELLHRVRRILFEPRAAWPAIAAETIEPADLYRWYIAPLAAVGPLASLVGLTVVGVPTPFLGALRYPIASALAHAVVWYLLTLGGVYLVALVADLAAPSFGGQRDTEQAFKVVAFASTATWVAGVVYLVPSLGILALLGSLYSVYLLYLGVPEVMAVPRGLALGYTAVVAVAGLVAFFLVRGIAQAFLTPPG